MGKVVQMQKVSRASVAPRAFGTKAARSKPHSGSNRLEQVLKLQDELDQLLCQRIKAGENIDFSAVPSTPAERLVWDKMTHPRFKAAIETLISLREKDDQSRRLWLRTLDDCRQRWEKETRKRRTKNEMGRPLKSLAESRLPTVPSPSR